MGLERFLADIGDVLAEELGDPLPYRHGSGTEATTVTVAGFLKWKDDTDDPVGRPTKRQKIPVVRVHVLPWGDDDVIGDAVTVDAQVWRITGAYTRASGWTDLYVADPRPA